MEPYPFHRFLVDIETVAKKQSWRKEDLEKFIDGLGKKRQAFSLMADGGLDSLDVVETTMSLEELLMDNGYPNVKFEGDAFDNAKNIGDFYEAICGSMSVQPDYAAAA